METAKIDVLSLLKQRVRPEFLNRLDEIIVFKRLTRSNIEKITRIMVKRLIKTLQQNKQITMYELSYIYTHFVICTT